MTVATELGSLPVFAGIPTDELLALAAELTPVRARVGEVLMRQGEKATSFFIIASGEVEVRHTDSDGTTLVAFLSEGLLGEIALLRNAPRTATVVATDEVQGYLGHEAAFERLLEIPGIATQLVRSARQRLAAFLTPIPFEARDGTELMLRPVLPGDIQRVPHGQMMFSPETLYRRFLSVKPTVLTYLFEVDYVDHFVWVVTDGADGPVIAGARFVRDHNDPTFGGDRVHGGRRLSGPRHRRRAVRRARGGRARRRRHQVPGRGAVRQSARAGLVGPARCTVDPRGTRGRLRDHRGP